MEGVDCDSRCGWWVFKGHRSPVTIPLHSLHGRNPIYIRCSRISISSEEWQKINLMKLPGTTGCEKVPSHKDPLRIKVCGGFNGCNDGILMGQYWEMGGSKWDYNVISTDILIYQINSDFMVASYWQMNGTIMGRAWLNRENRTLTRHCGAESWKMGGMSSN